MRERVATKSVAGVVLDAETVVATKSATGVVFDARTGVYATPPYYGHPRTGCEVPCRVRRDFFIIITNMGVYAILRFCITDTGVYTTCLFTVSSSTGRVITQYFNTTATAVYKMGDIVESCDLFSGLGLNAFAFRSFATPILYCEKDPAVRTILESVVARVILPAASMLRDVRSKACIIPSRARFVTAS